MNDPFAWAREQTRLFRRDQAGKNKSRQLLERIGTTPEAPKPELPTTTTDLREHCR